MMGLNRAAHSVQDRTAGGVKHALAVVHGVTVELASLDRARSNQSIAAAERSWEHMGKLRNHSRT
ncbi:hypothetical protein [Arthrobacter sp. UYEF20]|uniref:hypothetical protein n=1 Tax=Arthrobacter sp. UYEF20 TaxID=1756363 RepID=UPI003398A881